MSNSTFLCVAVFSAKENQKEPLLNALNTLVDKTREEPGCVSYELFVSAEDPNKVLVHEVYASETAFQQHSDSSYLKEFLDCCPQWVENVSIQTA